VYLGALDIRLARRVWSPPWRHHKGIFHRLARRVYSLSSADLRPVSGGDRIGGFRAFHTPGHNPGHTVFVIPRSETALLGDLVWSTDRGFVAPPWIDSYDTARIVESITRISNCHFETACTGHGPPLRRGGAEALRELADELTAEKSRD
jgi:glyoxylase-like metal-dependent hydrolase (beta-lactamase superfamily II)